MSRPRHPNHEVLEMDEPKMENELTLDGVKHAVQETKVTEYVKFVSVDLTEDNAVKLRIYNHINGLPLSMGWGDAAIDLNPDEAEHIGRMLQEIADVARKPDSNFVSSPIAERTPAQKARDHAWSKANSVRIEKMKAKSSL